MNEEIRDELNSDDPVDIETSADVAEVSAGDRQDAEVATDEIERLRERVAELEAREELATLSAANSFLGRLAVGPELERAAEAWLKKKSIRDPLPAHETAVLFAAMFRRVVRVGALALVVAAVPVSLLVWQNFLIQDQNQFFREQNKFFREQNKFFREQNDAVLKQIDLQAEENARNAEERTRNAEDTRIVRRAQLLATIYDCTEKEADVPVRDEYGRIVLDDDGEVQTEKGLRCFPDATERARREAVIAFAGIERSSLADGEKIDLTNADLAGLRLVAADLSRVNLIDADLSDVDLMAANLSGANLRRANLSRANLIDADLMGANLMGANLMGADLMDADLSDVDLMGANLDDVDLIGANLMDANLSRTRLLASKQIADACGDDGTEIPENLERPAHWIPPAPKPFGWKGCPPNESN